jgi:hypothetical protein
MDEKTLLDLWNVKRSQIIHAQLAPTIVLVVVAALAVLGEFETATDAAKYLVIGIAAASGILAIIAQYAVIREAAALVADLKSLTAPSEVAKKISNSGNLLQANVLATLSIGVVTFALVVWAVLG